MILSATYILSSLILLWLHDNLLQSYFSSRKVPGTLRPQCEWKATEVCARCSFILFQRFDLCNSLKCSLEHRDTKNTPNLSLNFTVIAHNLRTIKPKYSTKTASRL